MNNKNNQLIKKVSTEITTNLSNILSTAEVVKQHFSSSVIVSPSSLFGLIPSTSTEVIKTDYPTQNLIKEVATCCYEVDLAELAKLLTRVETDVRCEAVAILNQRINNLNNGYFQLLNKLDKEYKVKTEELEFLLAAEKKTSTKLQAKLADVYQKVNELETRKKALSQNHRSIPSKDRIELELIQKKYQALAKMFDDSTDDFAEKLAQSKDHIKELTESLSILEENYANSRSDYQALLATWELEAIQKAKSEVEMNSFALELEHKKLEITHLQSTISRVHQDLQAQIDQTFLISEENINLNNQINTLKSDLEQTTNNLTTKISTLEKELQKTTISLELKEKNLKDIQRLNFESKLKLQGVLFLDSLRSVTPTIFSKTLTTIETSIFISGITKHQTIEKCSWITLAVLLVISILYTLYKFTKFSFFKGLDIYHWLKGKKKDLTFLKEKELEEWKQRWNVGKNYSFVDLENIRKDKEVVDIEINDQFNTSNLKVNKLHIRRKKTS